MMPAAASPSFFHVHARRLPQVRDDVARSPSQSAPLYLRHRRSALARGALAELCRRGISSGRWLALCCRRPCRRRPTAARRPPAKQALSKESHFFNGALGRHNASSAALYRSYFPTCLARWWCEAVKRSGKVRPAAWGGRPLLIARRWRCQPAPVSSPFPPRPRPAPTVALLRCVPRDGLHGLRSCTPRRHQPRRQARELRWMALMPAGAAGRCTCAQPCPSQQVLMLRDPVSGAFSAEIMVRACTLV